LPRPIVMTRSGFGSLGNGQTLTGRAGAGAAAMPTATDVVALPSETPSAV